MHMEERVAKLESDVAHIRSDISEMKQDIRDLRNEVATQGKELRSEIAAQGKELRGEILSLAMTLEKFKGSQRVVLTVIIVLQLVATGGVAGAVARAFNLL